MLPFQFVSSHHLDAALPSPADIVLKHSLSVPETMIVTHQQDAYTLRLQHLLHKLQRCQGSRLPVERNDVDARDTRLFQQTHFLLRRCEQPGHIFALYHHTGMLSHRDDKRIQPTLQSEGH